MSPEVRVRCLPLLLLGACASPADDVDDPDAPSRVERLLRGADAASLTLAVLGGDAAPVDVGALAEAALADLVEKPGGIDRRALAGDAASTWTRADLDALADGAGLEEGDDEVVVELMVVPGRVEDEADVLGWAWGHRRIALFAGSIDAACASASGGNWSDDRVTRVCDATWASVLLHELGHTLGLVADGAPMVVDHEDPDHPHHDPDEDCVMHWQFERPEAAGRAGSRAEDDEPITFCPASLDDLEAVRER